MVYTGKRGIFFGGLDDLTITHLSGDTWDWNGSLWIQRQNMGPIPRAAHSMVYDDDKNVAVMFGGTDNASNILGDTWELIKVKT
jgi:hypothetical protein